MFRNIQEVFNFYRTKDLKEIENRAQEINTLIDNNPNVDINSLNTELEGLKQAKENITEKRFNPITMKLHHTDILNTTEYRSAFFKKLMGQELNQNEVNVFSKALEKRSNNFSSSSNSSAILPTHTLNEIIEKARKESRLLAECRNFNIPANISVPIATPSSKAIWHQEGQPIDTDRADITSVLFTNKEIIKIFSMSVKVRSMSIDAFESYLINELATCVMECISDSIVNGTGGTQGMGILNGVNWDKTNTVNLNDTYEDFTKALGMLKSGYAWGSKWAMNHTTLYGYVYNLVDNVGNPLLLLDPQHGDIAHILGKEVVVDDNIPDGIVLLGHFKSMGYNIPDGIMLEASSQSSFTSGLIDYRAMAIADTQVLIPEAFIKLVRTTPAQ